VDINHPETAEITQAEENQGKAKAGKGNITLPTALTNLPLTEVISLAEENLVLAKTDPTKEVTKSLGPKALLLGKCSTTTTLKPFTKPSSGTNLTRKDTNTGPIQEFLPTT
jgi:hypothetical protein